MISFADPSRDAQAISMRDMLGLINSYAARRSCCAARNSKCPSTFATFSSLSGGGGWLDAGPCISTPRLRPRSVLSRSSPERTVSVGRSWSKLSSRSARQRPGIHFRFHVCSGIFQKLGFLEVERGELPLKAWKDCLRCPKFQNCDEIAMLKQLEAPRTRPRPLSLPGFISADEIVPMPYRPR